MPPPDDGFHDLVLELPHGLGGELLITLTASGAYRSYHVFVLQPLP